MRPARRRAIAVALAAMAVSGCGDARPLHGTAVTPPRPAPAFRLVEHSGRAFDLAAQRDAVVLLYLGYTHCPDVCQATLANWARVKRQLGPLADRVRFVFVSVDPESDTPADVQAYVRRFDPDFIGLAGDPAAVAALERGYMTASHKVPGRAGGAYEVAHGTRAYLIDPRGDLRALYPPETPPDDVVGDIRHLLR